MVGLPRLQPLVLAILIGHAGGSSAASSSESAILPSDVYKAIVAEGRLCTALQVQPTGAAPTEAAWEISCREGGGLTIHQAKAQPNLIWIQDCAQLTDSSCVLTPPRQIEQQVLSIISSAGIDCQGPRASFSGYEFDADRVYYTLKCALGRSYIVSGTRSGAKGRAMRISGDDSP